MDLNTFLKLLIFSKMNLLHIRNRIEHIIFPLILQVNKTSLKTLFLRKFSQHTSIFPLALYSEFVPRKASTHSI